MLQSRFCRSVLLSILCLIPLLLQAGCAFQGATVLEEKTQEMGSIAVVGFIPVLSVNEEPGILRGPIQGAVYMAHPVSQEIADNLTESVYSKVAEKGYRLIPPGQARTALAGLHVSNPRLEGVQLYREIGKTLSSDGVLIGYLFRWWEREGKDFAVDRPASVGFDLYLLRSEDGAVVWRGKLDKTQQSFFENLLDAGTFLKSKGKWVKAEALAEMGLNELLEKFPKSIREVEKE